LVGRSWDEIKEGESASITRVCTPNDLVVFAHASGNLNPVHLPGEAEQETGRAPVAPAMWCGSLFSAVFGNKLPGPGAVYRYQELRFHARVEAGEAVEAKVRVREKLPGNLIVMDCRLEKADGTL